MWQQSPKLQIKIFFKSLICFVLSLKPFVKSLPFLAHKFTHTKQSSVSAHLSEVTSWEPISLFCNFTKVHSRLHLQKRKNYPFSIATFNSHTDQLIKYLHSHSPGSVLIRLSSAWHSKYTHDKWSFIKSTTEFNDSLVKLKISFKPYKDIWSGLTGWLMWNLVGILRSIAESRSCGRLVAPIIMTFTQKSIIPHQKRRLICILGQWPNQ